MTHIPLPLHRFGQGRGEGDSQERPSKPGSQTHAPLTQTPLSLHCAGQRGGDARFSHASPWKPISHAQRPRWHVPC